MRPRAARHRFGRVIDTAARSASFWQDMRAHISLTVAIAVLNVGVISIAFSQQAGTAPKDILPPTIQKSTVSPTLSVTTPANISEPAPIRTAVTPQAPAAPTQSKPESPQPAVLGTNTVPASSNGQPVSSGSTQSSPWDRTNAPLSSWDKSAPKSAADPWAASPSKAQTWDSTLPLTSSGTKTEWK